MWCVWIVKWMWIWDERDFGSGMAKRCCIPAGDSCCCSDAILLIRIVSYLDVQSGVALVRLN